MPRRFRDLTEREILALAISLEEEDARIYGDFADGLREEYPATAKLFSEMVAEEHGHRDRLIETFRQRFGEHIPLLRRQDVSGFVGRKPVWLVRPLGIQTVRKQVEIMELETRQFYEKAQERAADASVRQLLGDLAQEERRHLEIAETLEETLLSGGGRADEDRAERRLFVLQVVQPGLAGLMDGSVCGGHGNQQQQRRFSRRDGGVCGGGHFDGLCGIALGRRLTYRTGKALDSRSGVRTDDDTGRNWAHASVPHFGFSYRDGCRACGGGD